MVTKVQTVSQYIKIQASKAAEKSPTYKGDISTQSSLKYDSCSTPDHLKKLMLEYKHKTRKNRKECLTLVHTSSKSSSNDDSGGGENEDKTRPLKTVNFSMMGKVTPTNNKRHDDSWSSLSDNEDTTN